MLQKVHAPMFCTAVDGSIPRRSEGDYSLRLLWTLVHELDGAVLVFVLR
jgi:hypothetical protein